MTPQRDANPVMAKATNGLCPWLTAKEVTIPAPIAATRPALSKSFSIIFGYKCLAKVGKF